ncbi:MAG TPA: hypothetical protein VJR24_04635 [Gemmatimonadaceae bacterium]|nr:hypothetical protein [Gemmatimonadaceae bacterium]
MITLAIIAELFPVLAALAVGRRLSRPSRLIAVLFLLWFAEDLVDALLRHLHHGNNWVLHLTMPFEAALMLWAFSLWQDREVARRAILLALPIYVAVWLVLQLFVERLDRVSQYAGPMSYLLVIAIAAFTLVSKSAHTSEPGWRQPWFWISAGMIIDMASQVAYNPITNILIATHQRGTAIFQAFAAVGILSYSLTTWGILCERRHPSSGGSSSLPPWQLES